MAEAGRALKDFARNQLAPAIVNLGAAVLKAAKEHPVETAIIVVSVIIFFKPAIISMPILLVLGWGLMGPRAGKMNIFGLSMYPSSTNIP